MRAAGVLVALTTTVGLAGCAGQPGAAAVVDGTAIPTSDVEAALTELLPWFQGVTTTNVLSVLIQEPTVVDLAEEKGVGVSDEEAQALLDQVVKQKSPDATATFTEPSLAVARYSIAYSNLEDVPNPSAVGEEIDSRLRALDIEVNPRFASLEDGFQVGPPARPSWLVGSGSGAVEDSAPQPTPEPTPSAS
ncbi:hypothetical protein [Cellulomonas sp. Leaf334]|uniref:hypothetical protein n=1 Tax=Cellulomonas sp. Leaf334 TaxID=1736339 RepID=UPI0006FF6FAC|nr:hypothetical protein [Cellulomonas sp. Leaf334]KQR12216.1 hypothetical protein ASF78_13780 [Cellulomonas sp. Leaf334]